VENRTGVANLNNNGLYSLLNVIGAAVGVYDVVGRNGETLGEVEMMDPSGQQSSSRIYYP
jgi:hypothetical protein